MNRKQRRAAAAKSRKTHQELLHSYLTHLPKVDRPDFTKPGVTHVVFFHDDWCDIYTNARMCTCNPDIEYRVGRADREFNHRAAGIRLVAQPSIHVRGG